MKKLFKILVSLAFVTLLLGVSYFIFRLPINNLIDRFFTKERTITINYHMMDPDTSTYLTSTEQIKVKRGSDYDAEIKSHQYYHFNYDTSTIGVSNIQENITLNLYYDCDKCTVTFNLNGGNSTDELIFQINKGASFKAPNITKEHYTITGFENYQEKIYEDTTFTPIWEATKYKITFQLVEGCSLDYMGYQKLAGSYNYVTTTTYFETVLLPIPTSNKYHFQGWLLDGVRIYTLTNVESDLTIQGEFDVVMYNISFLEETGQEYQTITSPSGALIDAPYIDPAYRKAGMGLVWYLNDDYTDQYLFTTMPQESFTLYGRWEMEAGCGFLDFDVTKETIDSVEELTKFIDYVYFNYITIPLEKEMTCAASIDDALDKFEIASKNAEYRSNTHINFNASTSGLSFKVMVSLSVSEDTRLTEATETTEPFDITPYKLVGYNAPTASRDPFFDDFYIDKLSKTYPASTTNQLLYVVEHGYKPICSSQALTIYNKAKDVLRNIVTDEMGDFEKVERIFQYLVMNIKYDFNVLNAPLDWEYYDAYFMEGVFNNQKAVCDGIAKAMVLLCNIEGIPCVEVSGNSHAWCEVKVKNHWFVIDATHGNVHIEGTNNSVIDYSEFLISKDLKQEKGYTSKEFANINCDLIYPYFETLETIYYTTYSFIVTSAEDLAYLWKYAEVKESNLSDFSVNFKVETDTPINELIESAKAKYLLIALHPFTYSISLVYDDSISYKICKMMFK